MHRFDDGEAEVDNRPERRVACDSVAASPPPRDPLAKGRKEWYRPARCDWRGWIALAWALWWGWLYGLMVLETKFPHILASLHRALAVWGGDR